MKTNNPTSRYKLKINKKDKVLEIGGGHNPHPRSNMVVDKFVNSNYHRKSDIKVYKNQQFFEADGANLPFENNEFDYVICNQVLEHVEDPAMFLAEQMRVAKRGYIETPSLIGEYLFPKKAHKWLLLEIDNKLILMEKDKYWFNTNLDMGYVFLTWLQKTSLAYKTLIDTNPNFITVRYEWEDGIEFVINPTEREYQKYFNEYWDKEMASQFFPQRSKASEFLRVFKSMFMIAFKSIISVRL